MVAVVVVVVSAVVIAAIVVADTVWQHGAGIMLLANSSQFSHSVAGIAAISSMLHSRLKTPV